LEGQGEGQLLQLGGECHGLEFVGQEHQALLWLEVFVVGIELGGRPDRMAHDFRRIGLQPLWDG